MTIFYRITSKPSKNVRPFFQSDKYSLVEFCLKSLVMAFRQVRPKIVFIFDDVPNNWLELLELVPFDNDVVRVKGDQNSTYTMQLDLAQKEKEYVFFAEDDYYYTPQAGSILLEGMKELPFVNPYDHLEFYTKPEYHFGTFDIKLTKSSHWREDKFNTMTFGGHSDNFRKNMGVFKKHGYWDKPTWEELSSIGVKLYSPMPSVATHMDKEFLSPIVNWDELWKK